MARSNPHNQLLIVSEGALEFLCSCVGFRHEAIVIKLITGIRWIEENVPKIEKKHLIFCLTNMFLLRKNLRNP
jgi:hypothetical protein